MVTLRDSVVFYRSFYEAIKDLPAEQFKASVKSIMDYGLDDKIPETNGIEKTVYIMAKPQIDANNTRYKNGTKGGRPVTKLKPSNNQKITELKSNNNQTKPNSHFEEPKDNVKEKDKDNVKEKDNKTFIPPSVGDVSEYCLSMGYHVSAESFVDFYTSKGWMVGKNKMKDWKAAVRNWNRSQRQESTAKAEKNRFNNFPQRDNTEVYEALERMHI